jgi:hypothetical protein
MNFLESFEESLNRYDSCEDDIDNIDTSNTDQQDNINVDEYFVEHIDKKDNSHHYNTRYQARLERSKQFESITKTQLPEENVKQTEHKKMVPSKPISIPVSISQRQLFLKQKPDLDASMSDYIMIDCEVELRNQSEPTNNISKKITESFKEYLNSSVTMLRHSYNYIINNKSI